MNITQILLINIIAIPLTAGIDYLAFHKQWEQENPGKQMKIWYFIPACTIELLMLNAGIILGATL